jgi:hypothetical protein
VPEIIKDGFANFVHQRILPRTTSFLPTNRKTFRTPIKIAQNKSGDFTAAQAVNGKKQDHCSCAVVRGLLALGILHQPVHVRPSWSVRQGHPFGMRGVSQLAWQYLVGTMPGTLHGGRKRARTGQQWIRTYDPNENRFD